MKFYFFSCENVASLQTIRVPYRDGDRYFSSSEMADESNYAKHAISVRSLHSPRKKGNISREDYDRSLDPAESRDENDGDGHTCVRNRQIDVAESTRSARFSARRSLNQRFKRDRSGGAMIDRRRIDSILEAKKSDDGRIYSLQLVSRYLAVIIGADAGLFTLDEARRASAKRFGTQKLRRLAHSRLVRDLECKRL